MFDSAAKPTPEKIFVSVDGHILPIGIHDIKLDSPSAIFKDIELCGGSRSVKLSNIINLKTGKLIDLRVYRMG